MQGNFKSIQKFLQTDFEGTDCGSSLYVEKYIGVTFFHGMYPHH